MIEKEFSSEYSVYYVSVVEVSTENGHLNRGLTMREGNLAALCALRRILGRGFAKWDTGKSVDTSIHYFVIAYGFLRDDVVDFCSVDISMYTDLQKLEHRAS